MVGRLLVPALVSVEVDAIFDRLMPDSDRNRGDRLRAYGAAHVLARRVLDSGRQPYLECTYARRDQRASLVSAIPDVALFVVELVVTPDEAVARFAQRDQDSDLTEESLRAKVEAFPWSDQALRLEPGPPTEQAWRVLSWLESGPAPIDAEAWVAAGRD
ncbi:MAG: hypothetical protein JWO22_1582 [Frankiales bacterium]|nr:hypothetical protein [Frankiales bacterium]